jgi:hypothetical protein
VIKIALSTAITVINNKTIITAIIIKTVLNAIANKTVMINKTVMTVIAVTTFLFANSTSVVYAENYESTIYGRKLKKSSQLEVKSEEDQSHRSYDNLSEYLNHRSPIFFQFSLIGPAQWSFRGSSASHSLLVIDDNPVYDPSTIQGTWDLNLWPTSWAQNIIIETSPFEGTLKWGGHGSGSLVKIESIDKSNLNLSANSAQSIGVAAGKKFDFGHLQLLKERKNNRSPYQGSREIYPLQNNQALMKFQIPLASSEAPLKTFLLYGDSTRQLPDWNQDSKDFKSREKHQTVSLSWAPKTETLNQSFSIQNSGFERSYINTSSMPLNEKYSGNSIYLNYSADLILSGNSDSESKLKFGFSRLEEHLKILSPLQVSELRKRISNPIYLGYEFYLDEELTIQVGTRNETSGYSPKTVLNPALEIKGKQWSLTFFKAIKQPSLYQLYDSLSGNPQLEFEKIDQITVESHGEFVGNAYQIFLFNRTSKNIVDYDTTNNKYYNIARSHTNGLETHFNFMVHKLKWELMGTLQKSQDQNNKLIAPEKILSNSWSYPLSRKIQTQLSSVWNSKLVDRNLPSYSVWNWSWQYLSNESDKLDIFTVAVHNLTQTNVARNKQYLMEDRTINFMYSTEF